MLGLEKGVVKLLPHDEKWHQLFAEEKVRLQDALGKFAVAVQHIGSTSVCGISAKPILDIAVAVGDQATGEKCVLPLENLGYVYRGENGIPGRFYFVKGAPRTHHLHMLISGTGEFRDHLLFRDHLRQNSEAANEYDKLKKDLAQKHGNDRNAYLDGKAEFVEKILKIARQLK